MYRQIALVQVNSTFSLLLVRDYQRIRRLKLGLACEFAVGQELERLVVRLSGQTTLWLFADFCPHPSLWRRVFIRFMYMCFRYTTGLANQHLSDVHAIFKRHRWSVSYDQRFARDMIHATSFSLEPSGREG